MDDIRKDTSEILTTGAIRLGVMVPLTGLVEIYGREISLAAQIAGQEVNESGGVLGRSLELIIADDGSLPESAVAAAEQLVQQGCSALVGNLLSNSRIAVAYRVAEPRKIPYLNFSFYEGRYPPAGQDPGTDERGGVSGRCQGRHHCLYQSRFRKDVRVCQRGVDRQARGHAQCSSR